MTKNELKEKLLAAGLDEAVVDDKLATVTDAQLKEFSDIPEAEVLKEFAETENPGADADEQVFVLDEGVIDLFVARAKEVLQGEVAAQLKAALADFEIEIPDVEIKEVSGLSELKEAVDMLNKKLEHLLKADESRLKEKLEDMPRQGKLRITRFKSAKPVDTEPEDETDEDGVPSKRQPLVSKEDGVIYNTEMQPVGSSMTEFMLGGE